MRTLTAITAALVVTASASDAGAGELKGTVKATGMRTNGDAVVYLDTIQGKTFPPAAEHALMDQRNMQFMPHVLPVLVWTTVDFKNSDGVLHNVFTPDKCADKFNLGSWPTGQIRSYTFRQPCAVTLLCNVHPEMEGFVVVVPTSYLAVTDKAGAYVIKDIPDGAYTVKIWHPRLKKASQQINISGTTIADFELKK